MGTGSKEQSLRDVIETQHEGIKVPSTVRWLSGALSVRTYFKEGTIKASSVALTVADEDTFRHVIRKLHLQGRIYDNKVYEEAGPDVRCGRCCEWGNIE